MLELYLAFLIFGGLLLAGSLILGGDHHSSIESGADTDIHLGDSHSVSIGNHSIEQHSEITNISDAVKFVSFRNFIYFSAFFGLTGTILTLLDIVFLLSLPISLIIGGISAYTGYRFMKYLKATESGEAINILQLEGKVGEVTVNIYKNHPGKLKIEFGGKFDEFIAILSEDSSKEMLSKGEKALVIDIENNKLIVTDFELN